MDTSNKIEKTTSHLNHIDERVKSIKEAREQLNILETALNFVVKNDISEGKLVDIYKNIITALKKENELLSQYQDDILLEDIQGLLELNQKYIRKTNEQFNMIEDLRAELAKKVFIENKKKMQDMKAELTVTKQELRNKNKKVRELHDKIHVLRTNQNERRTNSFTSRRMHSLSK